MFTPVVFHLRWFSLCSADVHVFMFKFLHHQDYTMLDQCFRKEPNTICAIMLLFHLTGCNNVYSVLVRDVVRFLQLKNCLNHISLRYLF